MDDENENIPFLLVFFYPFLYEWSALWPFFSLKSALRAIDERNIKVIYTTSSPYSSWVLAYLIKRKRNVKWIADLRDPFTDGYMWLFPSKLHWYFARMFEKKILSKADKLVVTGPSFKKLCVKRNLVAEHKIEVITNGY